MMLRVLNEVNLVLHLGSVLRDCMLQRQFSLCNRGSPEKSPKKAMMHSCMIIWRCGKGVDRSCSFLGTVSKCRQNGEKA